MKHLKNLLILAAGLLCSIVVPVVLKELVLKPLRFSIFSNKAPGELFQWTGSIILIFTGYLLFSRFFIERNSTTIRSKGIISELPLFTGIGAGSILLIVFILYISGSLTLTATELTPERYHLVVMLFLLCLTEELLYRGLIYRLIELNYGIIPALSVSAILFSIGHFFNEGFNIMSFLEILLGGTAMGLLFSLRKSIWAPLGFHFGWNYAQSALGLTLSGTDEFSALRILSGSLDGSALITGGDFGIENSIITIAYTAVMTLYLGIILRNKNKNLINN